MCIRDRPLAVLNKATDLIPMIDGSVGMWVDPHTVGYNGAVTDITSAVWAKNADGSQDMSQVMVAALAFVAGDRDGGNTDTIIFKRQDALTAAITMNGVDSYGNTTSVVVDL